MKGVKFHFGKARRSIYDWVKLGVVINLSIDAISMLPGLTRKQVFNYVDSVQRRGDHDFLNEYIIKDTELLKYRVERVLDKAVREYNNNG